MKQKTVFCVCLVIALSLMLSSCNSNILGVRVMSNKDYQQLLTDKAKLETDLKTSQDRVKNRDVTIRSLETDNTSLTDQVDLLTTDKKQLLAQVDTFRSILCPQSWDEAYYDTNTTIVTNPVVGILAFYTQWLPLNIPFNDYSKWTTLILDNEGTSAFMMDTANDCIFVNPDFLDLGPANGSFG
jgi:hypothetical protein